MSLYQEQGMAAQIVQVVIAGNSIEFSRGLLNGQVTASMCSLIYCKMIFLKHHFLNLMFEVYYQICLKDLVGSDAKFCMSR